MLLDTEKLVVLWEQRGPVPFIKRIELDPRRALGPKRQVEVQHLVRKWLIWQSGCTGG